MSHSKAPITLHVDQRNEHDPIEVHLFPVPYAFRPEEAAAYIRLNRNDINDWINAGELPAMKVGIRTIIKRADLEQFVTDRAIYRSGNELQEDAS